MAALCKPPSYGMICLLGVGFWLKIWLLLSVSVLFHVFIMKAIRFCQMFFAASNKMIVHFFVLLKIVY